MKPTSRLPNRTQLMILEYLDLGDDIVVGVLTNKRFFPERICETSHFEMSH